MPWRALLQVIGIPRTALRPVLVAWPTLTQNMARVVTERRVQLGSAKELEIAQLSEVCAFVLETLGSLKTFFFKSFFVVDHVYSWSSLTFACMYLCLDQSIYSTNGVQLYIC